MVNLFGRGKRKEPTFGEQIAYAGEVRPQSQEFEASNNPIHHFTLDESVLNVIKNDPATSHLLPIFSQTSDTNFLGSKGCKILCIKQRKAFKYAQLAMDRDTRRERLPFIKSLEALAYARVENNQRGNKIKTLTTVRKRIVTGEAKKGEL